MCNQIIVYTHTSIKRQYQDGNWEKKWLRLKDNAGKCKCNRFYTMSEKCVQTSDVSTGNSRLIPQEWTTYVAISLFYHIVWHKLSGK